MNKKFEDSNQFSIQSSYSAVVPSPGKTSINPVEVTKHTLHIGLMAYKRKPIRRTKLRVLLVLLMADRISKEIIDPRLQAQRLTNQRIKAQQIFSFSMKILHL